MGKVPRNKKKENASVSAEKERQMSEAEINELKDLKLLSIAYGHPAFRLLLIKELNFVQGRLEKENPNDERLRDIAVFKEALINDTLNSPIPMRPFTSTLGNFQLIVSNRNDSLLVAESINTPPGMTYAADHPVVEFQSNAINTISELFSYICNYVYNLSHELEPETLKSACEVFQCDRIVPVVQKREYTFQDRIVENHVISLGFMRETDAMPVIGEMCGYLNKMT